MPSQHEVVIAAAGSGKTDYLVSSALAAKGRRVLIVAYTNENLREIHERVWKVAGTWPPGLQILSWYQFLLRHGVKPYQTYRTTPGRIRSINFVTANPPFSNRADFDRYYLDSASNVYSDAVSDLVCDLNMRSDGKVMARLESVFDLILIDEIQDLAGWDLEFLALMLDSQIAITLVGDPRQAVYSTNRSNKNSKYRGAKIAEWFDEQAKRGKCRIRTIDTNYRSNQMICDYADSLYPKLPQTKACQERAHTHRGVYLIHQELIGNYRTVFSPQELRWSRGTKGAADDAMNFGEVKGLAFDHVLIHATKPMIDFIEKGVPLKDSSLAKYYVAVTRARHSVAILTSRRKSGSKIPYWVLS